MTWLEQHLRRLAELAPEHGPVLLDAADAVAEIALDLEDLKRRLAAIDVEARP